jgi:hypothetical protein
MLAILGALIPPWLLTEILVLIYTRRIIQLTKSCPKSLKDAHYSNLEGYL